jgi:hypothetical protein
MWVRGVIKIPIPSPPTPPSPPQAVAMPAFDYIIDIYSDKVVITDTYGNTVATLDTVNDLNTWLKNVKGKRIRMNIYVEVTSNIELTQNEYWIFGEWINANVYILEPNTAIYSWAPMGNAIKGRYVTNWSPYKESYVDVSGLKLYAFTYADINIRGIENVLTLQNIIIYVASSSTLYIMYVSGDLYINGGYVSITDSALRNAYIVAWDVLYFRRISGNKGNWIIISLAATFITQVSLDNVSYAYMMLTHYEDIFVNANTTTTVNLSINLASLGAEGEYYIKAIGVATGSINFALDPLPPGITWSIDPDNAQLTIVNNTSSPLYIEVVYCVEAHKVESR